MNNKIKLDPYPIPKDKTPLYINDAMLAERFDYAEKKGLDVPSDEDNVRVYIPLDINKKLILNRLEMLINYYEEANEDNEFNFSMDVEKLITQIEIYDRVWYLKKMPKEGDHSKEAIELVGEFVAMLEEIPDGCAELFPFEIIDELRQKYLG